MALLLATGVAEARSEKTLAYPRDQAWPAAVRFIRVDAKLKITEKDADAGYVMFELKEEKRTFRGSLEIIDTVEGRPPRGAVRDADRGSPEWMEVELLDRLERSCAPSSARRRPRRARSLRRRQSRAGRRTRLPKDAPQAG